MLVTNDTLHHDLNVRDEIQRFGQRYADRMEEYSNILATNLVKEVNTLPKKKTTSRFIYLMVV